MCAEVGVLSALPFLVPATNALAVSFSSFACSAPASQGSWANTCSHWRRSASHVCLYCPRCITSASIAAANASRKSSPWSCHACCSAPCACSTSRCMVSMPATRLSSAIGGNSTGSRSNAGKSFARSSKPPDHNAARSSAPAVSCACKRHRSAASSARRSRSLVSRVAASKPCPLSSACSRSTRAQKPWMVKIAARSVSSVAWRRRRRSESSPSSLCARCDSSNCRVSTASALSPPASGASSTSSVSCRRSRMRLRNSCVAASVKVTARTWPMRRPRSTTSRVTSVARVKVLPVPALASISCTPSSGMSRYGSRASLMRRPPTRRPATRCRRVRSPSACRAWPRRRRCR